jgi:hypothetical protein
MSIGHPPHKERGDLDEVRGSECIDNVLPFHEESVVVQTSESSRRDDELFAALSPLLQEAAGLQGDPLPSKTANDFLRLLEENSRLRKLAVKLSNILGDLPARAADEIEPGSSGG